MNRYYVIVLVLLSLFIAGCSTKYEEKLEKKILTPESVEVYDIDIKNFYSQPNNRVKLLQKFPFISNQPVFDFRGKFSDEFYDKIDYRYKAIALKDVDFWKLRTNPFLEDFIYLLPIWVNKFQKVSNDLFQNIGYSYNLSLREQEILKWWIGQGGIFWIEGGIYSTRYDTFKKDGEIDSRAIVKKLLRKSKNMSFFDRRVKRYMYKSKKIDLVNYIPLKLEFKTKNNLDYFRDIKNLKIQTQNYLSVDFLAEGKRVVQSSRKRPLVTFIPYGKGGVVFVRPFEFKDKRYDGELLRWKLLYFLLNKMYLKKTPTQTIDIEEITIDENRSVCKKLAQGKPLILSNLEFDYKSSKVKKESLRLLKPIASYLKAHKDKNLSITGYTDSIGSKKYNQNLSMQRAVATKEALIKMGISAKRLFCKGYGEEHPIASNKTPQGRKQNRRVEFMVRER